MEKYICPRHDIELLKKDACPKCLEIINSVVPDAQADRLEELKFWCEEPRILTVNIGNLLERVEKLMGRPVWDLELAHPEDLIHELETNQKINFDRVLDKIKDFAPNATMIPLIVEENNE